MKLKKAFLPFFVLSLLVFIFYRPFFLKKLLPIPADILPGVYLPWLDLKYQDSLGGVPVKNALPSDVISLTYPLRLLSINLFKKGTWPLYNPQILSGTPLLANIQSASLYPLNILYYFSKNFSLIWSWQIIFQLILAFFFTYLFLKNQKLSTFASIFGATAWSTGGFFSLWSQYNTVVHSIVYLPLALLSVSKMKKNSIWGLVLSFSLLFSFFAGNPPTSLILFFTLTIYLFLNYKFNFKSYFKLIPFLFLFALLSTPLLLPSLQVSQKSIRKYDQVASQNKIKTAPLSKIVTLTSPDFYGNPSTRNQWKNAGLYDNLTIFQGSVLIFLALYSLTIKTKHHRFRCFSLILLSTSLLLIFKNPFSDFVGKLQILGLNSMVLTRFHSLLNFSFSLLATITFDHFIKNKKIQIKKLPILISVIQIIIPLFIVSSVYFFYKYLPQTQLENLIEPYEKFLLLQNIKVSLRNSVIPLVITFCTIFIFYLIYFFSIKKLFFLGFLFFLMIFENYNFFRKYNTFTQARYLYPETPITTYLKENSFRFVRENGELIPSNTWMPYGLNSVSGYDTLHSLKYNQFLSFINNRPLSKITNRYPEIENISSPLLNFLSVDHFVAIKRDEDQRIDPNGLLKPEFTTSQNLTPVFDSGRVTILKNLKVLPLFFSVKNFVVSSSLQETETYLKTVDLKDTAILETKHPPLDLSSSKISSFLNSDTSFSFSTANKTDALIVSSLVYDPSWKLFIDKKPAPLLNLNHAFTGFFIPPGNHQIKIIYHPNSFFLGLKLFLLALFSVTLYLIYHLSKPFFKKTSI